MHKSKGKWRASAKDTWCIENSLSPIILAYLEKLYEQLGESECHGVPMYYMDLNDQDIYAADKHRMEDLKELIWVFGSEEPRIEDYDFDIKMNVAKNPDPNARVSGPVTFDITNQEEYDRYTKDVDEYWERKKKGFELFGKIYLSLDW